MRIRAGFEVAFNSSKPTAVLLMAQVHPACAPETRRLERLNVKPQVDARISVPRIGRILMARGRDAADVALTTTCGANQFQSIQV